MFCRVYLALWFGVCYQHMLLPCVHCVSGVMCGCCISGVCVSSYSCYKYETCPQRMGQCVVLVCWAVIVCPTLCAQSCVPPDVHLLCLPVCVLSLCAALCAWCRAPSLALRAWHCVPSASSSIVRLLQKHLKDRSCPPGCRHQCGGHAPRAGFKAVP